LPEPLKPSLKKAKNNSQITFSIHKDQSEKQ